MKVCPFRLVAKAATELPECFREQHHRMLDEKIPSDLECIGVWCQLFDISDKDEKELATDKGRCSLGQYLHGPR